jgi:serine-type D-Ala-D-Ala carboxypeptidase (penicillin-binding protein 5/6)
MSVLQGGQLRRGAGPRRGWRRRSAKRHRRAPGRRWLLVLLMIVLALAALLALMDGRASGPSVPVVVHHVNVKKPAVPLRSSYGIAAAPTQIRVHLKLPLKTGLLFNVRTGQVLWSRDSSAIVPIASLTKMMTALVVVQHVKPSARALITRDVVHFSGSGMGVLPLGKRVSVLTLLYGLLLPSGNDAAIALAQRVAGTQARFISMMNTEAHALGLSCTHFTTVSGIVDRGNHSCVGDLALLAHDVLMQPLLARIVGSARAVMPLPIKGGRVWLYNNNPLYLLHYRGTDGVKTGLTTAAGHCLVATARRGRRWLGVVLLHSANTAPQAQTLLNAGFAAR